MGLAEVRSGVTSCCPFSSPAFPAVLLPLNPFFRFPADPPRQKRSCQGGAWKWVSDAHLSGCPQARRTVINDGCPGHSRDFFRAHREPSKGRDPHPQSLTLLQPPGQRGSQSHIPVHPLGSQSFCKPRDPGQVTSCKVALGKASAAL